MKIITFVLRSQPQTVPRIGILIDNDSNVVDLQAGHQILFNNPCSYFQDMLSFLDGGEGSVNIAEKIKYFIITQRPPKTVYSLHDITLLSPVPRPRSLRSCIVFEKRLIQATKTAATWKMPLVSQLDSLVEKLQKKPSTNSQELWYKSPAYYKGNPFTVVGTNAPVYWPSYTNKLDYELEIGIFIGKVGKNIKPEEAHKYIAGYTIYNDFSARDVQIREMMVRLGPSKGKDFDTGNAIGPYLVTPDEVSHIDNLAISAKVNGTEWVKSNSSEMPYSFAEIIAYISRDETLYPGEFIGSGTVGKCSGLELNRWLKRGDVVELSVENLGVLRNVIV
ncbi:MAG TPA: fumarylacetoacetate hydrolase family protein [Nostocaceae cyanobacterium]|nr:fumarylacetoacetate hydrolase family protein [Nostocaceae cyanobacterium]